MMTTLIIFFLIPSMMIIAWMALNYIRKRNNFPYKRKFIFIRKNDYETRFMLHQEGFMIGDSCMFKGSVWLAADELGYIYGVGYPYESMENLSPKEMCAYNIGDARECGYDIVDCGTDLIKFIKEAKRYAKVY